jgi:hypothetical protein
MEARRAGCERVWRAELQQLEDRLRGAPEENSEDGRA